MEFLSYILIKWEHLPWPPEITTQLKSLHISIVCEWNGPAFWYKRTRKFNRKYKSMKTKGKNFLNCAAVYRLRPVHETQTAKFCNNRPRKKLYLTIELKLFSVLSSVFLTYSMSRVLSRWQTFWMTLPGDEGVKQRGTALWKCLAPWKGIFQSNGDCLSLFFQAFQRNVNVFHWWCSAWKVT